MDGVRRGGARPAGRPAAPRAWAAALAALALLLSACGGESGSTDTRAGGAAGLRVAVTPPRATPGESVKARVVNESAETFTYGLAYVLERREGDSFVKVAEPRIVPQIALIAEPGETGPPVDVRVPGDAPPGDYRVVIQRGVPDVGVLGGDLAVTADH